MGLETLIVAAVVTHLLVLGAVFRVGRSMCRRWDARMQVDQRLADLLERALARRAERHRAQPEPQGQTAPDPLARTTRPPVPRVMVSNELLTRLARGIRLELEKQPGKENGFALVGRLAGGGACRRLILNGMIDSGPLSERSPGHVQFDRAYQQAELDLMRLMDPRASHLGDAHLHPGAMNTCSSGDFRTDLRNVRASSTREMVFVIATLQSAYREPPRSSRCICIGGIRLDFYYLGHASGFRYAKIRPELAEEPALVVPDYLRQQAECDWQATSLDWQCLQLMRGTRFSTCALRLGDEAAPVNCVELSGDGERLLLLLPEAPWDPPQVLVELNGELVELDAPAPGTDRTLLLSRMVLAARRALAGRRRDAMEGADGDAARVTQGVPLLSRS
jgi:hypothetical protein